MNLVRINNAPQLNDHHDIAKQTFIFFYVYKIQGSVAYGTAEIQTFWASYLNGV